MNNTLLTVLVMAVLVLLIISPFAALSILMVLLFVSAVFWMLGTLVQVAVNGDTDHNEL